MGALQFIGPAYLGTYLNNNIVHFVSIAFAYHTPYHVGIIYVGIKHQLT